MTERSTFPVSTWRYHNDISSRDRVWRVLDWHGVDGVTEIGDRLRFTTRDDQIVDDVRRACLADASVRLVNVALDQRKYVVEFPG